MLPLIFDPLLLSRTHDICNLTVCRLDRLVVQLDSQGGDPLGQGLGNAGHLISHLNRQLGHRLGLRNRITHQMLIPDLPQSNRITTTDPLAQREPSDVSASSLQLLASLNDLLLGELSWAHGESPVCVVDGEIITQQTKKQTNKLTNK